jgi:8-oxo-dGTP diphosphatase
VPLPYHIATLLYCFNEHDDVLLLERAQEPNRGLWSPPGGKLHTATGESPYACGCREAEEELGLKVRPADLHVASFSARTVIFISARVTATRRAGTTPRI